jgi:galactose mutarotase-like enzyme
LTRASAARETTWRGLEALELDNGLLRVTVVPSMGGHVAELVDLAADRDLLWHNPRATPRPAPYGAYFDDWWSGGWDEIFPSGDSGRLNDEPLPYMGELWCMPWSASAFVADDGSAVVDASGFGTVSASRFTRRLSLRPGEAVLTAGYRIENLDIRFLPFTWGIHPAFAVTPGHRIDIQAREMLVGVSSAPELGVAGETYRWPSLPEATAAGGIRDVSLVRGREAGVFGGHWATLDAGWLALTDTATRRGIAIAFDREVFPFAWLWQVYGGWRGHHHLALEPWTTRPMDLDGAIAAGTARSLEPGEVLETEVAFVLYDGLDKVASVERAGEAVVVR